MVELIYPVIKCLETLLIRDTEHEQDHSSFLVVERVDGAILVTACCVPHLKLYLLSACVLRVYYQDFGLKTRRQGSRLHSKRVIEVSLEDACLADTHITEHD